MTRGFGEARTKRGSAVVGRALRCRETYIGAFGQALGDPVAVRDLVGIVRGLTPDMAADLVMGGLQFVRVSEESASRMALAAIEETLADERGQSLPEAIVVATSSLARETHYELRECLVEQPMLHNLPLFGVSLGGCAKGGMAVLMAASLIASGFASTILVVVADKTLAEERLLSDTNGLAGDGAAACLVSADPQPGGYAILGCAQASNTSIPDPRASQKLPLLRLAVGAMAEVTSGALEAAGLERDECTDFVCNNLVENAMEFMRYSCGVRMASLHNELRAALGHCQSADVLLTLRYLRAEQVGADSNVLALWSSYFSWVAVALRVAEQ